MIINRRHCNMCGRELDIWDEQEGFSIHKKLGYGTKYDGEILELNLCCECMNRIIEECKIPPIIPKGQVPLPEYTQRYSS